LYESDLDVLVEDLQSVQTKWEAIGRAFNIREETLEDIRTRYSHTRPGNALREVLRKWLPNHWEEAVDALRCIGEEHLASELKLKCCELSPQTLITKCINAEFSLNTVDISGPILLIACDSMGSCCSW